MSKPIWNVCYSDSNTDTIKIFNIFEHKHFMQGCDKAFIKAKRSDREVFAEEVKIELRYWFWSKCEWEIIIHGLFSTYNQKVDVFGQVMINWDRFIDYLWEWFRHQCREVSGKGVSEQFWGDPNENLPKGSMLR